MSTRGRTGTQGERVTPAWRWPVSGVSGFVTNVVGQVSVFHLERIFTRLTAHRARDEIAVV